MEAYVASRRGERLRGGASVTIVGPPNAGKSSLINLLGKDIFFFFFKTASLLTKFYLLLFSAQRRVAIVSEIPGTTRDVIETVLKYNLTMEILFYKVRCLSFKVLDIGGYPVVLADTAGLRHTSDSIEKEGVALAKEK